MKAEEALQIAVCNYIRLQYPDVIFTSESSGVRLTMGQAVKAKKMRSGDKLPDLWILEPKGPYNGLLMELKVGLFVKKNGDYKNEHTEKQAETIYKLRGKGYFAGFVSSFDDAKATIDWYMKQTTK